MIDHKEIEVFEKLNAIRVKETRGLEAAIRVYPTQKKYILSNKDKSLKDVEDELLRQLDNAKVLH